MTAHHPIPDELPDEIRALLERAVRNGALDAAVEARAADLGWQPSSDRLFSAPRTLTRVPPLWGPR